MKGMRNNRIMQFYGLSVSLFDDKLNWRGLSNTARRERLPKKIKVTQ